jgi:hypothetical protein
MKPHSSDSRRIAILLAIAVCVHLIFLFSLHFQFLNPLFYITTHAKGQAGPFFGIYQAGVNLNNGESIYASQNYRTPAAVAVPYYHFYRYLPFTSYISAVASRVLKPWPAYWLWVAINEIMIVICVILTIRLRHTYGSLAIAVATFWLLYSPLYIELHMGQFCFTMAFFIFLILYPYLSQGPREQQAPVTRRSSVSWVLSMLLKSFTAVYTLTFFKIGKKKLAVAGIAVVVLTSIPYFLYRPEDFRWFLHLNFHPLPAYVTGGTFGFNGLLRVTYNHLLPFLKTDLVQVGMFDVAPRNIPLLLSLAAIMLVTLLITVRQKHVDPLANITLWTLTFFLVFKDIWEYHYVMLIPLFIAYYLRTRSKIVLVLFVLCAVPTPFFLYDIPASDDPQEFWSTSLTILHHSFKAVPTFLFYLWVADGELRKMGGARALLLRPHGER